MKAIDEVTAGHLPPNGALQEIGAISHAPPSPTWLFALAAGAGAASLSVLYGIQHIVPVMLIVLSAAAGAVLRRILAHYSTNSFLQPLCAALLAGMIGALAVRYQLSSPLRLVAVCPCMILVPGPHVLNGMMDLSVARISLGASRLLYAGLVVLAISAGLLLGLSLLGVSLPVGEPGRAVPLWLDILAAGDQTPIDALRYRWQVFARWKEASTGRSSPLLGHRSRFGWKNFKKPALAKSFG